MHYKIDMPWGEVFWSSGIGEYGVKVNGENMPDEEYDDLRRYWNYKHEWIERWYPDVLPILEEISSHDLASEIEARFRREQRSIEYRDEQLVLEDLFNDKNSRDCFIRFGKSPRSGYSFNGRDRIHEDDVSVYRAKCRNWMAIIDMRGVDYVSAMFIIDRQPYTATGSVVGSGADGEPLLKHPRVRKFNGRIEVFHGVPEKER